MGYIKKSTPEEIAGDIIGAACILSMPIVFGFIGYVFQ